MSDPCPTCGHIPEPTPTDWLTEDEARVVDYLTACLADDRATAEARSEANTDGHETRNGAPC